MKKRAFAPLSKSAALKRKIWASRVLRMVRLGLMPEDHPDAIRAFAIIGPKLALKAVRDTQKATSRHGGGDAIFRRLPGSFETGRRR
jgi:hypothetical protein